jgi:hypothetical protein
MKRIAGRTTKRYGRPILLSADEASFKACVQCELYERE